MIELQQMSTKLKLTKEELIFLGDVDDMPRLYNRSDILVLTSEREGLPNCILEAMSSGLPVVANDVGGVSELVIDKETGFLIKSFEKDHFLEKLAILIKNKKLRLRMSKKARVRAKKYFSIDSNTKILTHILSTFK